MPFSLAGLAKGLGHGVVNALKGGEDKKKSPKERISEAIGQPGGGGSEESYKRGGKVRKTGLAKLHKGERVLTRRQSKSWRKRARK